jgi:UDPglucose 6-dehydrogenase
MLGKQEEETYSGCEKTIDEALRLFYLGYIPLQKYGKGKGCDLKYIELCARQIAKIAKDDKIVVEINTTGTNS